PCPWRAPDRRDSHDRRSGSRGGRLPCSARRVHSPSCRLPGALRNTARAARSRDPTGPCAAIAGRPLTASRAGGGLLAAAAAAVAGRRGAGRSGTIIGRRGGRRSGAVAARRARHGAGRIVRRRSSRRSGRCAALRGSRRSGGGLGAGGLILCTGRQQQCRSKRAKSNFGVHRSVPRCFVERATTKKALSERLFLSFRESFTGRAAGFYRVTRGLETG